MNYNSNNLYNNYIQKNTIKKAYQTEPYPYFQSPQSQKSNNNTMNPYQNLNQNYSSTYRSNYNNQANQTIYSPHSKNSLKWRNLMKINLPQLKHSRDINLIQSNLDNLVFGEISEEDIQSLPELNIVKLIQILQTSCDILLNEQQDLEGEMLKLENENVQIIKDFKLKEENAIKNKDLIRRLKKEKQRDLSVLQSYINVINNLKNGTYFNLGQYNANITDINIKNRNTENINLNNINSNKEGEFKCEHCPGKKFMTEFELNKHLSEIHGINKNNINNQNQINNPQNQFPSQINIQLPPNYINPNNNIDNNSNNLNNDELMKKMDDMKKEFKDTFLKLQEEKKKEQEEFQNIPKIDYNQQMLDRLENTFKETVNDFKLMMEKNKEEKNEPNIIIQNNANNDDYNNWKKKEISRLNDELKEKQNEIDLEEKNYINQIEELEKSINILTIEINQNKKYKEDEDIKSSININTKVSINRPIEYQTKPIIIKEKKQKTYFNSGKLLSDHDETDEELKNKKRILDLYSEDKEFITKIINKNKTVLSEKSEIPSKVNNTINQNTFFNINNIKNDIIPEVSPVLEVSNTKDSNIINSNLRNIDKRNVKLDNYYKRYIKRDNNYILESEFSNYFIETLPKKFDLDPQINQQANDLMDNKIKETGAQIFPNNINMIHEVDEEKLKEENTDNLKILINSLFNNMENKNTYKNGKQDEYYTSIKELLGFNKLVKNAKDIDNKPKTEKEKFNKRNLNNQINEELNEEDKNDLLNKNKNINEINTNSNINNVDIKIVVIKMILKVVLF